MSAVRPMLARIQRLEHAKLSPLLKLIGTPEQFAARCQAGVDASVYDRRDMPGVIAGVLSWTKWQGPARPTLLGWSRGRSRAVCPSRPQRRPHSRANARARGVAAAARGLALSRRRSAPTTPGSSCPSGGPTTEG
jgi:hypothetical protein